MPTHLEKTKPAGGDPRKDGDDAIRNLASATAEIMAVDHIMNADPYATDHVDGTTGAGDGEHAKVTFGEPLAANPWSGTLANRGSLFTKDVSSVAELFWEDEAGNVIQLTSGGKWNGAVLKDDSVGANAIQLEHDAYLTAAGHTSGSVNLLRSIGDAGSEYLQIANGARTATSAAPEVDGGIANKKYVDDTVAAGWTPSAYAGEESVTLPNGLIMKFGEVGSTSGAVDITFGTAFPTGVISASLTYKATSGIYNMPLVSSLSVTKIGTYRPNTGAMYWVVIGY